jgi:hypothetical protein
MGNSEFGIRNAECGIKRGGRESSSTKDFSGENAKHDLL